MSLNPHRREPSAAQSQIATHRINEEEVNASYEVFAELRKLAASKPYLIENPYFQAIQDTAYARFVMNFEALI